MFQFLTKKNKPILGIDISSTAVKLIELTKKQDAIYINNIGYSPIKDGIIVEHSIHDIDEVGKAISIAVNQSQTKLKQAIIAIPESFVMSKIIYMNSSLNEDDIIEQLQLNINQYIPSASLDDVAIDFEVIARPKNNKQCIMLIACKKHSIDVRMQALKQAGLIAKIVDTETFACQRVLQRIIKPQQLQDKVLCSVNIGANYTTFFAFKNQEILFTKEFKFGGLQLTKNIQKHYQLNFEEAEAKKLANQLTDDYQQQILNPFCDMLSKQISQLIQYFYSATQIKNYSTLFISGGCSSLPNFDKILNKKLNKPIIAINPLLQLQQNNKLENNLAQQAPDFNIAYGLALRSFINGNN